MLPRPPKAFLPDLLAAALAALPTLAALAALAALAVAQPAHAASGSPAAPAAAPTLVFGPGVPVFVPPGTPAPVRLAVEDLLRDLEKVLGAPSPIVSDWSAVGGRSALVLVLGGAGDSREVGHLHQGGVEGPEAHALHVKEHAGRRHLVLEGADVRGLIYAIYSFSDLFLDVPPLWFWSDWKPARRDALGIPGDTLRLFPPAQVRWRAWFNNDTDFLTPWRARTPANNQAIYETILRLKYNTYEVGSVADFRSGAARHAPNPDAARAHERGLAITHHHTSPLGSSLGNWKTFWQREAPGSSPPELSVRDTRSLTAFWRYHADTARHAGFEQVWTLVFRGARDIPFWETYPDAPADAPARAKILGDMLRLQAALVKEVTGDPEPAMRTTLYNEGSTLFAAGLLRLPEDPSLIWNFVAARRDHFPAEDLRGFHAPAERRLGYYLNFQFTSTGSHLAAAEGPWKMAANYRAVEAAGGRPPAFTVVNAGNIREHLTELSANADMMARFSDFEAGDFLRRFCARYYGEPAAGRAAALYRDFYYAYWCQRPADLPGFERQYLFQDLRYLRAVEMLLKDLVKGAARRPNPLDGHALDNPDKGSVGYFRVLPAPGDADQVDALLRGTAAARTAFADVAARADALLPEIVPAGRLLWHDNLCAQARLMVALNTLLHETTSAYRADAAARRAHLAAALQALDGAQAALDSTRHGPFAAWYDVPRRDTSRFGSAAPLRRQFEALLARPPST